MAQGPKQIFDPIFNFDHKQVGSVLESVGSLGWFTVVKSFLIP